MSEQKQENKSLEFKLNCCRQDLVSSHLNSFDNLFISNSKQDSILNNIIHNLPVYSIDIDFVDNKQSIWKYWIKNIKVKQPTNKIYSMSKSLFPTEV